MARRTTKRDLTYYRTRTEYTPGKGTTYTPYAYDGPLTYEVAREAIRNLAGLMFKADAHATAPAYLRKHHADTLTHRRDAIAHQWGDEVDDRLSTLARRLYKTGRI